MKCTLIDRNVLVGRLTSFQELFNTNSRELWGRLGMIIFQEIEPLDCTVCILYELTVRPCRHTCFPHESLYLPCVIPPAPAGRLAASQHAERQPRRPGETSETSRVSAPCWTCLRTAAA